MLLRAPLAHHETQTKDEGANRRCKKKPSAHCNLHTTNNDTTVPAELKVFQIKFM